MADSKSEHAPAPRNNNDASDAGRNFDLNRPTIISLLYLASFITGITAIIGAVLAYVWKGEPQAEWEASHYTYLIRTFWIGMIGAFAGIILMVLMVGFVIIWAAAIQLIIRCVLSLLAAQKQEPMPNPKSWLI